MDSRLMIDTSSRWLPISPMLTGLGRRIAGNIAATYWTLEALTGWSGWHSLEESVTEALPAELFPPMYRAQHRGIDSDVISYPGTSEFESELIEVVKWYERFRRAVVAYTEVAGEGVLSYRPKTPLGERLWRIRADIIASGEPLFSWEEVEKELAERRGEYNG